MASELRVNTLKDAAGNNSVGMEYVANGSAKAWADYDGGTPDIRDSLNTSSFGDNGTGDHTQNLTNSMASANYSYQANGQSALGNFPAYLTPDRLTAHTASAMRAILSNSGNSASDGIYCATAFFGDLA